MRSNLGVLRELTAPALTMAVVKANAYGHGALGVAQAAVDAGADWLGVADLDEALALRSAGIEAPMLAWLHGAETDFTPAVEAGIDLGHQLARAAGTRRSIRRSRRSCSSSSTPGSAATGSTRVDAPAAFVRAAELESEGRLRVRGIFSHLSNSSRADDDAQLAEYTGLLAQAAAAGLTPELRHLAATEAAITRPDLRFDLVRIGIGLYGLPAADELDVGRARPPPRDGARRLRSPPCAAHPQAPASATASPTASSRRRAWPSCPSATPTACRAPPRIVREVSIGGTRYPVVGRIAMDQFLVDVGDDDVTRRRPRRALGRRFDRRPLGRGLGEPGPTPSTTRS